MDRNFNNCSWAQIFINKFPNKSFAWERKYFFKRPRILINPRFQLRFIKYFLVLLTAVVGGFYSSTLYFFWKFKGLGISYGIPLDNQYFTFLSEQQALMNQILLVPITLLLAIMIVSGLLLSYRIYRPLLRLREKMRGITGVRNFKDLELARGDFFSELVEDFNLMMARLKVEQQLDSKLGDKKCHSFEYTSKDKTSSSII